MGCDGVFAACTASVLLRSLPTPARFSVLRHFYPTHISASFISSPQRTRSLYAMILSPQANSNLSQTYGTTFVL